MTKKKKKKKRDKKKQKKAKKLLKKIQKQRIKSLINFQSIIDQPKIETSLVHHIPGRVRFRIYRLKDDLDYAANLQQFLLTQPGIDRVRINPAAASIAINYRYTNAPLAEIASKLM